MTENGTAYSAINKYLMAWTHRLKENRKTRADLRRCKDIDEIVSTSAYAHLYNELKHYGLNFNQNHDKWGYVVGLLSHVRDSIDSNSPELPRAMGSAKESDRPVISEFRFQRLMKIQTRKELYQPMIRIIRNLDSQINLWSLIDSVYHWEENDKLRRNWNLSYYDIPKTKEISD